MLALLKKEDLKYYISESDIVAFISKNAPMDWNKCCKYVQETSITNVDGNSYWAKDDVLNRPEEYNPEAIKWMKLFFEAHPFIEKVMIVFDD